MELFRATSPLLGQLTYNMNNWIYLSLCITLNETAFINGVNVLILVLTLIARDISVKYFSLSLQVLWCLCDVSWENRGSSAFWKKHSMHKSWMRAVEKHLNSVIWMGKPCGGECSVKEEMNGNLAALVSVVLCWYPAVASFQSLLFWETFFLGS